jgi:hypothetical protein
MLNGWQDIVLIAMTVFGSLMLMLVLNKIWAREDRRSHNDLIGWQLSILGTMYAVIVGFMLYTVWTNFGVASVNADNEANAVVNLHRLAAGLPAEQGVKMRELAEEYADAVVDREWSMMAKGKISPESSQISRTMWHTLMSIQSPSWTQITAEDHALYELSSLTEHRQMRQLQITSKLPAILWGVLLAGGALTIFSACMFGTESGLIHGIQVFSFSLLVAMALIAIADIDRPFQGTVHVSADAFRRAQINMLPQVEPVAPQQ